MVDWHMELSKLAAENQVEIYMYSRFVDDTADARKALTPGLRWEEGSMVMEPEVVEEDQIIPGYLRIMREFFDMGSSIDPLQPRLWQGASPGHPTLELGWNEHFRDDGRFCNAHQSEGNHPYSRSSQDS